MENSTVKRRRRRKEQHWPSASLGREADTGSRYCIGGINSSQFLGNLGGRPALHGSQMPLGEPPAHRDTQRSPGRGNPALARFPGMQRGMAGWEACPAAQGWINPYAEGRYQLWVEQTQCPKGSHPPWGAAEHRGAPSCCCLCTHSMKCQNKFKKCCFSLLVTADSPAVFKERFLPISQDIVPLECAWLWNLVFQLFCERNPLTMCGIHFLPDEK